MPRKGVIMNTKSLVHGAIFIALGFIFHYIIPGFFFGMKPDFMLFFMVTYIIIYPNVKNALAIGVAMGIMSAISTSFPGGQVANMIDKPIAALFTLYAYRYHLNSGAIKKAILYFLATVVSGSAFLGVAMMIAGLPDGAPFSAMFVTIVLPTAAMSGALGLVFDKLVGKQLARTLTR